jgi:hypothetical protein
VFHDKESISQQAFGGRNEMKPALPKFINYIKHEEQVIIFECKSD